MTRPNPNSPISIGRKSRASFPTVLAILLGGLVLFVATSSTGIGWMQSESGWRRTSSGWEYANALDMSTAQSGSQTSRMSFAGAYSSSGGTAAEDGSIISQANWLKDGYSLFLHVHMCVLAAALATLIASMSAWLLTVCPNRSLIATR